MSNELSTKDSEKLAKIRKEAKHNKACIYGAGLTEAFLGGTVIGQIACDIDDILVLLFNFIKIFYGVFK